MDCFADLLICDPYVIEILQIFFDADYLLFPEFQRTAACFSWRKLHNMAVLKLGHQFIHFLFSIAGCLCEHHVRKIEEWTAVSEGGTVACLDQRTKVLWQSGLCDRDIVISDPAKYNCSCVCSFNQFPWGVGTENSDNSAPGLLQLFHFQKSILSCFRIGFKIFR